MGAIYGPKFLEWLVEGGIVPENARRVVIEAAADEPVVIYVETYAQPEMLKVEPPPELKGAKIVMRD